MGKKTSIIPNKLCSQLRACVCNALAFAFCGVVICALNSSAAIGADLKKEFRDSAPRQWSQYLESLKSVEFTVKKTERYVWEGKEGVNVSELTKKVNLPYQIGSFIGDREGNKHEEIFANNPQYHFALVPSRESGKKWEIERLEQAEPRVFMEPKFPTIEKFTAHRPITDLPYENQVLLGMADALKIHFQFWFPSLAAEEEFEIVDVKEENINGTRIARVVYRYQPEGVAGTVGQAIPQSGKVSLLPDASWVVKDAEFDILDAGERVETIRVKTEIEYETPLERFPRPTKVRTVYSDPKGAIPESESVYEYAWNHNPDIGDKKEYYLSYYGFPEPEFANSFNWLRPALVLVGLILLFAACLFLQKNKRAKTAEEASNEVQ